MSVLYKYMDLVNQVNTIIYLNHRSTSNDARVLDLKGYGCAFTPEDKISMCFFVSVESGVASLPRERLNEIKRILVSPANEDKTDQLLATESTTGKYQCSFQPFFLEIYVIKAIFHLNHSPD